MESSYLSSEKKSSTREVKNLFVLYLTLNETLASEETANDSGYRVDDVLIMWKEKCRSMGRDVDRFVASIEIIGKNNGVP